MDWECDMEEQRGVTHLDDVSELLPNTQQVIDIVKKKRQQSSGNIPHNL